MKKVLIIGGAGYVGAELSNSLISKGYDVSVFDLFIYGENVFESPKVNKIKGDVREINNFKNIFSNVDCVIHLACISNDPSYDLDPELSKSINYSCFEPLIKISKESGVKKFIYASSSSVYGIKNTPDVKESDSLEPLTDYSKFKVLCEDICHKYRDKNFKTIIIRPATVCGYSKRQRLDLVVNILTNLAYHNRHIKVFGGDQLRPNIHIKDMVRSYIHVLESEFDFAQENVFNVGYNNFKVLEIANKVKNIIGEDVTIERVPTDDNRSYHVSSEKIKKVLNFKNEFNLDDAIGDLRNAFDQKLLTGTLADKKYFNIKMMQGINLK
jgi:nucleoside-diphosphate-sugar epimerase